MGSTVLQAGLGWAGLGSPSAHPGPQLQLPAHYEPGCTGRPARPDHPVPSKPCLTALSPLTLPSLRTGCCEDSWDLVPQKCGSFVNCGLVGTCCAVSLSALATGLGAVTQSEPKRKCFLPCRDRLQSRGALSREVSETGAERGGVTPAGPCLRRA